MSALCSCTAFATVKVRQASSACQFITRSQNTSSARPSIPSSYIAPRPIPTFVVSHLNIDTYPTTEKSQQAEIELEKYNDNALCC